MTDLREPARWLARKTLEPELRRDLLAYGGAAPSGAQRARMLAHLEEELGALDGPGSVGGLFSSSPLKLSLATGALVLGSLALLALLWPTAQAPKESTVRAPIVVAPTLESELREPTVRQVSIVSASAPAREPDASLVQASAQRGRAAKRRAARVDRAARIDPPSAAPSAPAPGVAPAASGPLAELTLLARARRALLVRPERALALAEQHASSYPTGTFREEREVLAIESLAKLGRMAEARQRVRVFERQFPSSTHRAHLAHLVAHE